MTKEINLLLGKKREPQILRLARAYLTPISLVVLLIFLIVSGVTFIYRLSLNSKKAAGGENVSFFTKVISSQKETEVKYFLLYQRLSVLEKIFPNRLNAAKIIKEIKTIMPTGATLKSLSVKGGGEVTLQLNADNSLIVEKTIAKLLGSEKFTKIKLQLASRREEPSYTLNLQLKTKAEENF